jgi:hypothetical protein
VKIGAKNFTDCTMAALSLALVYFIYFIALSTLVLMIGRYFSAKFSVVSIWVVVSLFIACIPLWLHVREILSGERKERIDGFYALSALLVSSAGGLTSASINRPDVDDSIYVPKAVFYLENQNQELDKTITWLAELSSSPMSLFFYYYEIIQASLASFFGLHFLDLYHVVFPAIVGFLMCLSVLLFISIFDQRRWACLFGLVLLMLVIFSLGETHRTFGNISIARAFHAKCMFLAVGVPAWIYFSLRFFALNQLSSWFALLAIGVGMVGATSTTMVFLPPLSGLLFASYVMSEGELFHRDNLILAFRYISALIPVVLIALDFRSINQNDIYTGAAFNAGFPITFEGQLRFLINPQYPITPILFIAAVIALLLYSKHRRFFAWWIFLAIGLFLNPLVSGFVIKYITTENIYWRLFYLIPFPTMVVIGLLPLFGHGLKSKITGSLLLVPCAGCAFWGPTSVIRQENGASMSWPGYKIHEPVLSVIKEITATVPEGSMFAPLEISSNVLLYSSKYPQFHMRDDFLQFALRNETGCAVVCRSKIYEYLYQSDITEEGRQLLEKMLSSSERPYVFVVSENSPRKEEINDLLSGHNYRKKLLVVGNYVLYEVVRDR